MKSKLALISAFALAPALAFAQQLNVKDIVELELLTHTEVCD